uniref:Synechocystis YCF37-like protein n=1 Tax=Phaseolus vulgaris TaxID=3885 RepID=T2DMP0_PHAVU|nr:synechocystis YCF37-like protein [Phaseolus vulgaris]
MVCAISSSPFSTLSFRRLVVRNATSSSCKPHVAKPLSALPSAGRRQLLFFLTASTALTARESVAQDIPLFGIRKSLKKVEEEAEEIVKEGFEAADKGLVAAEKGLETAEKELVEAEREIEGAVSFGGLAQAGAVAGAEAFGILVATAVVNGILGAEAQSRDS